MFSRTLGKYPVWYWLQGPFYVSVLACGHDFETRDATERGSIVWCSKHEKSSEIIETTEKDLSYEQDQNVLRERIAMRLSNVGGIKSKEQLLELSAEFGVPALEIKRINTWLNISDTYAGLPTLGKRSSGAPSFDLNPVTFCKSGKHIMTPDNMAFNGLNRKQCLACKSEAQKKRRQAKRKQ